MALAGAAIERAGVTVDVIDVGGGFPAAYPGSEPPPLGAFFAEIEAGLDPSCPCGRACGPNPAAPWSPVRIGGCAGAAA